MPQMSPLLWMPLFLFFSILMAAVMMKIYFTQSKSMNPTSSNANMSSTSNHWKW